MIPLRYITCAATVAGFCWVLGTSYPSGEATASRTNASAHFIPQGDWLWPSGEAAAEQAEWEALLGMASVPRPPAIPARRAAAASSTQDPYKDSTSPFDALAFVPDHLMQ